MKDKLINIIAGFTALAGMMNTKADAQIRQGPVYSQVPAYSAPVQGPVFCFPPILGPPAQQEYLLGPFPQPIFNCPIPMQGSQEPGIIYGPIIPLPGAPQTGYSENPIFCVPEGAFPPTFDEYKSPETIKQKIPKNKGYEPNPGFRKSNPQKAVPEFPLRNNPPPEAPILRAPLTPPTRGSPSLFRGRKGQPTPVRKPEQRRNDYFPRGPSRAGRTA